MQGHLRTQTLKKKTYQKEMKSTCVKEWTDYSKDLKIKEWRKEKQLDLKKVNVLELKKENEKKNKIL